MDHLCLSCMMFILCVYVLFEHTQDFLEPQFVVLSFPQLHNMLPFSTFDCSSPRLSLIVTQISHGASSLCPHAGCVGRGQMFENRQMEGDRKVMIYICVRRMSQPLASLSSSLWQPWANALICLPADCGGREGNNHLSSPTWAP